MFTTWEEVRDLRNQLLKDTDWTQVSDAVCDQWSYRLYRQHLRNLPQRYSNPEDVIFPEPPPAEQELI